MHEGLGESATVEEPHLPATVADEGACSSLGSDQCSFWAQGGSRWVAQQCQARPRVQDQGCRTDSVRGGRPPGRISLMQPWLQDTWPSKPHTRLWPRLCKWVCCLAAT